MNFLGLLFGVVALAAVGTGPVLAQATGSSEELSIEEMSQKADAFRKVILSLEQDAAAAQTAFDTSQSRLLTLQASITEAEDKLQARNSEAVELDSRLAQMRAELDGLMTSRLELSETITGLEAEATALTEQQSAAADAQSEETAKLAQTRTDHTAARNALAALSARKDAVGIEVEALSARFAELQGQTARAEDARDAALQEAAAAEAALAEMTQETATAQTALAALTEQHVTHQARLADVTARMDEAEARFEALVTDARGARDAAVAERDQAIAEMAAARADLVALQAKIKAETDIATLAAQIPLPKRTDSLTNVQIRNAVLAAPGLGGASDAQKAELEQLLAQGVCASDALDQAIGSTNRQTLAALIRSLGRC